MRVRVAAAALVVLGACVPVVGFATPRTPSEHILSWVGLINPASEPDPRDRCGTLQNTAREEIARCQRVHLAEIEAHDRRVASYHLWLAIVRVLFPVVGMALLAGVLNVWLRNRSQLTVSLQSGHHRARWRPDEEE